MAIIQTEKYATPADMCKLTGLSESYVRKIAKHLKHAGIITEHYISKKTCYRAQRVLYYIIDASAEKRGEIPVTLYNERFHILLRYRIYVCPIFPSEERLGLFIFRSIGTLNAKTRYNPTICCLVKPANFTNIDYMAIDEIIPMIENSLYSAKKHMLIKYFFSSLSLFEKGLANQEKV